MAKSKRIKDSLGISIHKGDRVTDDLGLVGIVVDEPETTTVTVRWDGDAYDSKVLASYLTVSNE